MLTTVLYSFTVWFQWMVATKNSATFGTRNGSRNCCLEIVAINMRVFRIGISLKYLMELFRTSRVWF